MHRLRNLARKSMAKHPAVKRWEDLDDVLQNCSTRLWKALKNNHPPTPLDYFRLAAAIVRRELIDLSRRYMGPMGIGANMAKSWLKEGSQAASPMDLMVDGTNDPIAMMGWSEFHEHIENMPEEDRMLFDLLWYQGLKLSEAAEAMAQSERHVRRRWRAARVNLHRLLMGESPPAN